MAGMTDYSAQNWLNYITGKAAMPVLGSGNVYIGLFTTAPTSDSGITGAIEVSGIAYARVQTLAAIWNSAIASVGSEPAVTPASISNGVAISFAAAGVGGWGTIVAFGIFDAPAGGNLLTWDYLGNYPWLPFSCSSASPGVLTSPAHNFSNNDNVVITSKFGGTLPTTAGSWSGLKTVAGATADTFNIGLNTTSTGDGMVRKIAQFAVTQGIQPNFTIASLVITAA